MFWNARREEMKKNGRNDQDLEFGKEFTYLGLEGTREL
jgi:hypothetical protein